MGAEKKDGTPAGHTCQSCCRFPTTGTPRETAPQPLADGVWHVCLHSVRVGVRGRNLTRCKVMDEEDMVHVRNGIFSAIKKKSRYMNNTGRA